jgi:2-polyprenyl-3-methyl-5-hydroxy-6-metoxy-1,4-benzoquinol methylase
VRRSLLKILRAPRTVEPLTLYVFDSDNSRLDGKENIIQGILLASNKAYPVIDGVPVMLHSSFTEEFLNKHATRISQDDTLSKLHLRAERNSHWSFSSEWDEHFKREAAKTWGWTVNGRMRQFLLETDVDPQWCKGKLVLDAGCGNGQLSEGLTELGATVVALDYSTSVFTAEKYRKSPDVHFIRGDLQTPPFDKGTFDLVISNGVLHHTPNTYRTFIEVSKLVKPEGRFYLWLYRKSEKFFRRYIFYPVFELTRTIVSRIPNGPQRVIVKAYALALMVLHKALGKHKDLSWPERVVVAYDNLTPLWRHYHTPLELSYWFFLNGYSSPTITHWDNPYGFGMVAKRKTQEDTPGVNFGNTASVKRYWR